MQYSQTTSVVGVAMDRFDGGYQANVLRGVCEAARERGANVLAFVGGQLGDDAERTGRARVFDLIGPESVDAVVIFGAALSHRAGRTGVAELCNRLAPLPICSVGSELSGASSVGIDNEAGMHDAVDHLARHHARRRIAFVRGPATIAEAELRFAVYRQALEHAGIDFDDKLVFQGDFSRASGAQAVHELFDVRGLRHGDVEAVACANDDMAAGVLDELAKRGLRVPRDLALVGFDDSEAARYAQPPLTTVRQPEIELGREALRLSLAAGEVSGPVMLATELVRRRSCGCFGNEPSASVAPSESSLGFQAALIERRQIMLAELARGARGQFGMLGRGWEAQLLSTLTQDILGAEGTFQSGFDDLIERCLHARIDIDACHDVLTIMRRHLMACLASDAVRRKRADQVLDEARISASRAAERFQAGERIALGAHVPAFSELCVELATARSLLELGERLQQSSRLGLSECHLLLADDDDSGGYRLALSHSERLGLRYPGINGGARNLMRRALPDHGHQAMAVLPLFSQRHLGFALVSLGSRLPIAYEVLRVALSRALDAMQR